MSNYKKYKCSDGTVFSSKDDQPGWKPAQQLAIEHEENLKKLAEAKKELMWYLILDNSHNEHYDREFCFYYKPELSATTKTLLNNLVFESSKLRDLSEIPYLY